MPFSVCLPAIIGFSAIKGENATFTTPCQVESAGAAGPPSLKELWQDSALDALLTRIPVFSKVFLRFSETKWEDRFLWE
jgi:hypothetical protein